MHFLPFFDICETFSWMWKPILKKIECVVTRGRNGEDFLLPASPRPVSGFYFASPPASPRKKLCPPRFFKVFILTVLAPEAAMEKICYSPPRPAPKKVFPASPRPVSSFYFSSLPRLAKSSPRPDSPPRFGLWYCLCSFKWETSTGSSNDGMRNHEMKSNIACAHSGESKR